MLRKIKNKIISMALEHLLKDISRYQPTDLDEKGKEGINLCEFQYKNNRPITVAPSAIVDNLVERLIHAENTANRLQNNNTILAKEVKEYFERNRSNIIRPLSKLPPDQLLDMQFVYFVNTITSILQNSCVIDQFSNNLILVTFDPKSPTHTKVQQIMGG